MSLIGVVVGIHCLKLRHQFSLGHPNVQGYVINVEMFSNHSSRGKYMIVILMLITVQNNHIEMVHENPCKQIKQVF